MLSSTSQVYCLLLSIVWTLLTLLDVPFVSLCLASPNVSGPAVAGGGQWKREFPAKKKQSVMRKGQE